MPLTQLTLNGTLAWTLDQPITGFADLLQGPDSALFTLAGLNLGTWSELFGAQYTIAGSGGTQVVNLNSFTDPAGTAVTALHALAFLVFVTGAATDTLNVKPGASNALQWMFDSATHGLNIHGGGAFIWSDPAAATGTVVSSSAANILLTNNGTGSLTVKVLAVVSLT